MRNLPPHYSLLPTPYSLLPTPYSLLPTPYSLLPTPYSLLPTPYSLLPTPYSLLPTPYSLLPTPYSLLPTPYSLLENISNSLEDQSVKPKQHIFYDGQIFDAYLFVSGIIKSAQHSIVLIDNYIDESTLILFTKRSASVQATLYTKHISKQLTLDLQKHNAQYEPIEIIEFNLSHDRFLIVDGKELYHFGASLKDLGKKWFAVSKMDINSFDLLKKIK